MERSRKIVLVSNCILNVNSKVEGIATFSGASDIVAELVKEGYGIIQLPCIEQAMFGIRRWGIVYGQCSFPAFRAKCCELLKPIVDQIEDFAANGYSIDAIIGMDGSPTCGVRFRAAGDWKGEVGYEYGLDDKINSVRMEEGKGVMMECLSCMLSERGLNIPFCAVNESGDRKSLKEILGSAE